MSQTAIADLAAFAAALAGMAAAALLSKRFRTTLFELFQGPSYVRADDASAAITANKGTGKSSVFLQVVGPSLVAGSFVYFVWVQGPNSYIQIPRVDLVSGGAAIIERGSAIVAPQPIYPAPVQA